MNDILQITIILSFAVIATLITRRLNIPEVVGLMIVGVLLSPSVLGWLHGGHTINVLSEMGVIFLMFLAGIESDVRLLKKYLKPSFLVALLGVITPMVCFTLVTLWSEKSLSTSFFYGIVFAATSVSITVQVLQEYGKLSTKTGNIILGAAVVDDILAILILSIYTSFKSGNSNLPFQLASEICFFILLILVYKFIPKLWRFVDKLRIPNQHISIALLVCLGLSLLANAVGMSAVIGSFFAGIAIGQTKVKTDIEESVSKIANVIFIPIFFVSIAISIHFESLVRHPFLIIGFTSLAILTKFLPAYYGGRICRLGKKESLLIGSGMVSRGEMALIVTQIGLSSAMINLDTYSELVIIILLTTLIAPFLIKATLDNT